MLEILRDKKIGLVLGSGAARGLAHIGVLKALEAKGIYPHIIVGTSMGAMVGGAYAEGLSAAQLQEIACETNWMRVAQILFPKKLQSKALLDGTGVEEFLLALLGERKIEDLQTSFACVAADIWTGEEMVMNTGSLVKGIRASISFPFLFSPLEINGRLLVDGGVVNPLPVNIAREMGAEYVIAVGATPAIKREIHHVDSGSILTNNKLLAAASSSSFYKRFKAYFDENGLIKTRPGTSKKKLKKPGIRQQMVQIGTTMENMILTLRLKESTPDLYIKPEVDAYQFFDFAKAAEIISKGEEAARQKLSTTSS